MWQMMDRILRDSEGFFAEIREEKDLGTKIRALLWLFVTVAVPYGFVMGCYRGLLVKAGWYFALASAVKVPVLFLGTLAVCLPATYMSNVLFGPRLSFRVMLTLLAATIAVSATTLAACLPIVAFFLIAGRNYLFIKLLHIGVFTLAGIFGLSFLWRGVEAVYQGRAYLQTASLKIWMVIYGFVGAQMGWMLRPYFGNPHKPFHLFMPQESNFYANLIDTLRRCFSG